MAASSKSAEDEDALIQTRIPRSMKNLLETEAHELLCSEATLLRQIVAQHYGLMPKTPKTKKAG